MLPNDLLHSRHGNVWTWCQEQVKVYPAGNGDEATEDQEDELLIANSTSRVLRGGSFHTEVSSVRSADRYVDVPTNRDCFIGFRMVRTFLP